jgi:CRP/FNR family transcriptional regulator, anaerobic regulatory protein
MVALGAGCYGHWVPAMTIDRPMLSERQKEHLALISSRLHLGPHTPLYERGDAARWIFQVRHGVVRTCRPMRHDEPAVTGFLFEGDLFGLATNGVYANSAQTLTDVSLLRATYEDLKALLLREPELEYRVICKLTHFIRRSQRHLIAVGRRTPIERVAMLISLFEQEWPSARPRGDSVSMPVSQHDIAGFLMLSPSATRNAFDTLKRRGLIVGDGPKRIRILDRKAFNALLPDAAPGSRR